MPDEAVPCFFHSDQLDFKPLYEWAFGERIPHPETTGRAEGVLAALEANPTRYELRTPRRVPLSLLRQTHDYKLITLYNTARELPKGHTFYPSVFLRSQNTADPTNIHHAGSFCFDSGTPLNHLTWNAASWSAACAVEAAQAVRDGKHRFAFALSRPPGHHASKNLFGGYCYFNNAALAAKILRRNGRVAVLDIDFHHGNGTQDIFWRDGKVLTISMHGDPKDHYPYMMGFPHETGHAAGSGLNLNVVLEKKIDGKAYVRALKQHALRAIRHFDPAYLVLAAGVDTYERDPVGDFALTTADLAQVGETIGRLHLPTAVIMEGGYYTPHIGRNVEAILQGLREGQKKRRFRTR